MFNILGLHRGMGGFKGRTIHLRKYKKIYFHLGLIRGEILYNEKLCALKAIVY